MEYPYNLYVARLLTQYVAQNFPTANPLFDTTRLCAACQQPVFLQVASLKAAERNSPKPIRIICLGCFQKDGLAKDEATQFVLVDSKEAGDAVRQFRTQQN